MKDFDLDIRHYSVADLESFFQVKGRQYDAALLQRREREWMNKVQQSQEDSEDDDDFLEAFRMFLQEGVLTLVRSQAQRQDEAVRHQDVGPVGQQGEVVRQSDMAKYEKPIVSKPDLPFVYARNSKYFGGTMNPLETHLVSRVICINSLFRDDSASKKESVNGGPTDWFFPSVGGQSPVVVPSHPPLRSMASDFVFRFPEPLKNVASMELMSIELPAWAWYDVTARQHSNYFTVAWTGLTGYPDCSGLQVSIPDGNYTAPQMQTAVNDALQGVLNGFLGLPLNTDSFLMCRIDSTATTFSYRGDLYPDFVFGLNFMTHENDKIYENLGWKLGFRQYFYGGNASNQIQSEAQYLSASDTYVFLDVDDYNRNNQSDAVMAYTADDAYIGNNLLARISLQEVTLQGVSNLCKRREYFGAVRLEKLRIRLLDRFGRVLDMHHSDYSLALEFKQIYS